MDRLGLSSLLLVLALLVPAGPALAQAAQRSAQGDCVREVERRGYSVLWTGNFEQVKDGWQLDVRARDHKGRVTNGSCFVETRSGDVSLSGFGWGGSSAPQSFEFSCASKDERYRECQLPIDGKARLLKRKSDAPCREGQSWGQRGDRVWVDQGCRATFEVRRGGGGSGEYVECRSQNNRYRECPIRKGYEGRLERDYSGRCRKDSTWGNRAGLIWVTSGCEGRFRVVPKGSGGGTGDGNEGQRQRAEVQCRNEASRQGIVVSRVTRAEDHGFYWLTTVEGQLRGKFVRGSCRFYPSSNKAELRL
jgi:hypothetical protein